MTAKIKRTVKRSVKKGNIIFTITIVEPRSTPPWWTGPGPCTYTYTDKQGILRDHSDEAEIDFGRNYGSEMWELSDEELRALRNGKTLAREINGGEYTSFLRRRSKA